MRPDLIASAPIRLDAYRAPDFAVDEIALDFILEAHATRVAARLQMRRLGGPDAPLRLNGVGLRLLSVAVDDVALSADAYRLDAEGLTIDAAPDAFTLRTEVEIDPAANVALEGLYVSGGRFCTQCEAEGFRKITFFPDRPDVLARFTVRLEAPTQTCPRLLSNGNLVDSGPAGDGRHYAVWRDPFPKPCYLFALVAGELDELADDFTTASGRPVALRIYVDPGRASRAHYAMDALKRAMRWDEVAYGREYDLDLFMIVAVRDFNFGAMENKGLNIFNSSLLLADPETATDADFERIESVVAHEYFHNWSGNRVTCRDWFQLCLKEGFTVFRDQGFSADERGHAVQRIKDVRLLRARQFPEDAGPLAHPVRPTQYVKIDNFYTATVYEKGAEIVGMLKSLLGPEAFRDGCDRYFARCDGTAATVEDFLAAFADAGGRDLSAFARWYAQAGTPRVSLDALFDEAEQTLTLHLKQANPVAPEGSPVPIPIRLGLLDATGAEQTFQDPATGAATREALVILDAYAATVVLRDVRTRPVLSALRGFSAPVRLTVTEPEKDLFVRLAADEDLFNRWEAAQTVATRLMLRRAAGDPDEVGEERYAEALGRALEDLGTSVGFRALILVPPGESDLAQAAEPVDPQALHAAREALRLRLAVHLGDGLRELHTTLQSTEAFAPDPRQAATRALRNAAIELMVADAGADSAERAELHFDAALNMTDSMGGLAALTIVGGERFEAALQRFYARWSDEPLVVDKWFAAQARDPAPGVLGRVLGLTVHPVFDRRTPNRVRALVQTFASANPARFHAIDGGGHRFLADQVLATDAINPMIAARFVESLGGWRRYLSPVAQSMRAELMRIVAHPGLSKNVHELAAKALGDA